MKQRYSSKSELIELVRSSGLPVTAIARQANLNEKTLRRFLRGEHEIRSDNFDCICSAIYDLNHPPEPMSFDVTAKILTAIRASMLDKNGLEEVSRGTQISKNTLISYARGIRYPLEGNRRKLTSFFGIQDMVRPVIEDLSRDLLNSKRNIKNYISELFDELDTSNLNDFYLIARPAELALAEGRIDPVHHHDLIRKVISMGSAHQQYDFVGSFSKVWMRSTRHLPTRLYAQLVDLVRIRQSDPALSTRLLPQFFRLLRKSELEYSNIESLYVIAEIVCETMRAASNSIFNGSDNSATYEEQVYLSTRLVSVLRQVEHLPEWQRFLVGSTLPLAIAMYESEPGIDVSEMTEGSASMGSLRNSHQRALSIQVQSSANTLRALTSKSQNELLTSLGHERRVMESELTLPAHTRSRIEFNVRLLESKID